MHLAFMGSPAAAVPPLRALVAEGHEVVLAVTQPDRRRGRGGALLPTPVKAAAIELGIPVTHRVDDVLETDAELGVVVAFGKLIKPHVLERIPMVNVHFSLLPRWRGAAPVERAILAGDDETGVCLMALDEGLDTGPVYCCEPMPIGREETAEDLRARLVEVGTELLVTTLERGLPSPRAQQGEPSYAVKLEPEDLHLDWTRSAEELHRVVRVGGAWTTHRGRRLRVWRVTVAGDAPPPGQLEDLVVGTGSGGLRLQEVQVEGKKRQAAEDWARGARLEPGERLGS